jgi:hypothetical protein
MQRIVHVWSDTCYRTKWKKGPLIGHPGKTD